MHSINPTVVNGRYTIKDQIGKGSFGTVYKGENMRTKEMVAIKFERVTGKDCGTLKHETTILNYLCRLGVVNIPNVRWYGMATESEFSISIPCLVIPLYERSLGAYLTEVSISGGVSALRKSEAKAMISVIHTLSYIHSHFVIHRDIKPDNLMVRGDTIVLIDFGLSSIFAGEDGIHNPENSLPKWGIIGSPKYISPFVHVGVEPSRRDDMISLGYIFIEFVMGGVLWDIQGIDDYAKNGDAIKTFNPRNRKILAKKGLDNLSWMTTSTNCHYLFEYLKECYSLTYAESPDYSSLAQHIII